MLAAGLCVNLKRPVPHHIKRNRFPPPKHQRSFGGVHTITRRINLAKHLL